jgi:GT2 family glycosyltransferase
MSKPKVDVVVPIYNSLDWLKMCVEALIRNTNFDILGTIYLMDDASDKATQDYLKDIARKWQGIIKVVRNQTNLGFIKTCNKAIKASTGDYVLLLNTDCIVSENAIEKMMTAMLKDKKIGLLCPISSVAANLSFSIPDGMNFMQINKAFEEQFSGMTFDACTVASNCLMISHDNINKVGLLDESFGKGYSVETDYQFKSMAKGFKAKVLIDTYVYHQSHVSFGISKKQQKIREENLKEFFSRWGKDYRELLQKYNENDPVKYIYKHVKFENLNNACSLFVTDYYEYEKLAILVNNLVLDHINVEVVTRERIANKYSGVLLFSPTIKKGIGLRS